MWLALKIETYVIVIALLLIIIRSIVREHDKSNKNFVYCCYSILTTSSIKIISLLFPFSSYFAVHYVIECFDFILWLLIPYFEMKLVVRYLGYKSLLNQTYFKVITVLPLVITSILSGLSPFFDTLFKLNLFGEPAYGKFYYVLFIFVVFYYAIIVVVSTYCTLFVSNSDDKKEATIIMLTSLILGGCQVLTSFQRSNVFIIATLIAALFFYINLHENRVFIDPLTGLNNRNRFRRYLSSILSSSAKNSMYLTYIDIDDFKKINDNYGHLVGDLALRTVAESMRDISAKNHSFIARIGGDEFVIISSHRNANELQLMLDDLHEVLNQKAVNNFSDFSVNFSVGSTPLNVPNVSINEIIKQADRNMYRQKIIKKSDDDMEV